MLPIAAIPESTLAAVATVFTDIDDTLTLEGRLPAKAYDAVERLTDDGVAVVPITGRPAGWCDMIARFWPVPGVVGENGAFYFAYERQRRRMVQRFFASEDERRANRARLASLRDKILCEVPGAGVASDQLYREADLAIDVCEDVPPLSRHEVDHILAMFHEAGAVAKLSSIHVNGWFGAYDKLSMTRRFAREILGLDIDADKARVVFVGDSPNDAPMFGFFPNACGVANVLDFQNDGVEMPAYVAPSRGADGFVEIAERILAVRRRLRAANSSIVWAPSRVVAASSDADFSAR